MLLSSTLEFYQDGRTNIRKKLPEDTLTDTSKDISFFGWWSAMSGELSSGQSNSLNVNHSVL